MPPVSESIPIAPHSGATPTPRQLAPPSVTGEPSAPQSNSLFAGQNRALKLLVEGGSLTAVFGELVHAVEADLAGTAVAAILLLDADGKRLRHGAAPSLPESYNRAVDGITIGPDIGTCCATAFLNEVVITDDIANDPKWSALKALPLGLGLRAAWSMPIRSTSGTVLGTFGTYFRECRVPTPRECEIVGVMAKTAALAIEKRAMEATLLKGQTFLQDVIGASGDCLKVIDLDGRIKWMSENGLCMMEVDDFAQIRDADWISFWPDESTKRQARDAISAARIGTPGRFRGRCPTLRGTPKWWDVLVTPIRDPEGKVHSLLSVSRDVTDQMSAGEALKRSEERYRTLAHKLEQLVAERTAQIAAANEELRGEIERRKRTEQARQLLLQRLVNAEENERRHISRELHDQVGQQLTALMLGLKGLQPDLSPARKPILQQLEDIAETISMEVHTLALELRPTALDDLGLAGALSSYLDDWSARNQLPVAFHGASLDASRLPSVLETAVYRIVQEAMTNVAKHACGRSASVVVERRDSQVLVIVEDDGIGFEVESALNERTPRTLGFLGIIERASACGGKVNIESTPGRGTAVYVHIPLLTNEGSHA